MTLRSGRKLNVLVQHERDIFSFQESTKNLQVSSGRNSIKNNYTSILADSPGATIVDWVIDFRKAGHDLEINQWIFIGRKTWFYSLNLSIGILIPLSKFPSSFISILYPAGPRIICGPVQKYVLHSCQEPSSRIFQGGGGVASTLGYTRGRYCFCSLVSLLYNDIFLSLFYLEKQLLLIKMKHLSSVFACISVTIFTISAFCSASYPIHSPISAPVCIIFSKHMVLLVPVLFILIMSGAHPKPPITVDNKHKMNSFASWTKLFIVFD